MAACSSQCVPCFLFEPLKRIILLEPIFKGCRKVSDKQFIEYLNIDSIGLFPEDNLTELFDLVGIGDKDEKKVFPELMEPCEAVLEK